MSLRITTLVAPPRPAHLIYDVAAGLLSGVIGARSFRIRAVSGGARGSTVKGVAESSFKSRLATTPEVKAKSGKYVQRGGPLPPGTYSCTYRKHHPRFHECVQLHRDAHHLHHIHSAFASRPIPHHRADDFFIHGRGTLGSDGCIVPWERSQRIELTHAIRDYYPGRVYLTVRGASYMLPAERFDGLAT